MPTLQQVRARKFNWDKARLTSAISNIDSIRTNLTHDGKITTKLNHALNEAQIALNVALKLWNKTLFKKGK
jgi:hypothetical protein